MTGLVPFLEEGGTRAQTLCHVRANKKVAVYKP